jgi:hypothetical protein
VIVISGALVLVALVLLIIGVVSQELPFVYGSIAVSLVSLVFLVIGILQRRGETVPATGGAGSPEPAPSRDADSVTAVIPSQGSRRVGAAEPAAGAEPAAEAEPAPAESADEELEVGGTVLVVEGRPRYHVGGCRYLTGKSAEPVDVRDAREEGFTPCGVCKPDESIEQAAEVVEELEPSGAEPQDGEGVVEEDVPGVQVPAARRAAAGGTRAVTPAKGTAAKGTAAKAGRTAAAKAPSKAPSKAASKAAKSAPKKASGRSAAVPGAAPAKAVKAPARTAAKAPSRAASAAAGAPAAAKRPGSVVVIPDRGKFHTAECRYVRDVDEAEVLSKSAATRQGYTACGVCKP